MYDFVGNIALAEAWVLGIAFIGTVFFALGYSKRNRFRILKMLIGGILILLGIYSQFAILEMPYLLIGLILMIIPIAIMIPAASPSRYEYRMDRALIIAVLFFSASGILGCTLFCLIETKTLEKENSSYVTNEVKTPAVYYLKELYDGKYLIADGGYQYELLPNDDTENLKQVVSPSEAIKILPLAEGDQPHLTIAETWQHAHCPGVKSPYGDATYRIERTVTIYVSLDQTAIAYSAP